MFVSLLDETDTWEDLLTMWDRIRCSLQRAVSLGEEQIKSATGLKATRW